MKWLFPLIILSWILILAFVYTTVYVIKKAWNDAEVKPVIQKEIVYVDRPQDYKLFEVTAYTAGFESTGKTPADEGYKITASGEIALERITMACPESMEFGTKIYIPAFENVFTCQDRGSAITEGKLDVYMEDLAHAKIFGRQNLEGWVINDVNHDYR